ncbi:MAG: hypothetical protein LUG66_07090 [Clostridiales bacterium]|nr:hypothetical protein [Clostridiales bacterium]
MAEYYYNMTKFVPEENRNYNPTMRSGYRTYNQYETLTRIYKDFSYIIEKNGKIVEDDLKNVYSKYDKELRGTELYSSSLYNPNNNVYYYISSPLKNLR